MHPSSPAPNLLFIFTDQQHLETLACYGNDRIEMPNLNRLAARSVVFDEPYCTQPVCTPSRGSLMTGLWPHTHGAVNNNAVLDPEARCLPELLSAERRQLYRTAYMGKWHLGDEVFAQHGYEDWISTEDGYYPYYSDGHDQDRRSSYHYFLMSQGFVPAKPVNEIDGFARDFATRLAERYGKPFFTASEASNFIRRHDEHPWLLTVNFLEPHAPNQSPRDLQYKADEMELPDNFRDLAGEEQPSFLRDGRDEPFYDKIPSEQHWREYIARYWGLNSLVDTHAGRILQALEETGQAERTIIVFTSDHGEMLGAHGRIAKCVMYKESVRVPLLIHLPGQEEQGRITGPVSQIDLVPTLLELLGEDPADADLPGRSLASLCRKAATGQTLSAREHASPCVIEWTPKHQPIKTDVRTIVTHEGERYSYYFNGEEELYDLEDDPRERHNLAHDPAKRDRIAELRRHLAEWQAATADTVERIQP